MGGDEVRQWADSSICYCSVCSPLASVADLVKTNGPTSLATTLSRPRNTGPCCPPLPRWTCSHLGKPVPAKPEQFKLTYNSEESFLVTNHVILQGEEAERFARVWRSQRFDWRGSMCFEPPFGIRFKTEGCWAFETAVCLHCHDFTAPVKGRRALLGFVASRTKFIQLSNVLVQTFGPR